MVSVDETNNKLNIKSGKADTLLSFHQNEDKFLDLVKYRLHLKCGPEVGPLTDAFYIIDWTGNWETCTAGLSTDA